MPYTNEIIRLYVEENQSVTTISKIYNVQPYHISNVLKKNKVPIKSHHSKYRCNENFFQLPLTREEQFYWLGFIIADGCVYERGGALKIKISTIDRGHLEKFLLSLKSDHLIKDTTETTKSGYQSKMSTVEIYNQQIYADLSDCGVVPNKTKFGVTLRPEFIENNHFWRGYFDGDGSIRKFYPRGAVRWDIVMTGCKDVVVPFRDLMSNLTGSTCKAHDMGNWWRVTYCSNLVSQYIAMYLYNNATIWLDRKKEIANELTNMHFDNKEQYRLENITCEKFNEAYERLGSVKKVAEYFNIGQTIGYRINQTCRNNRRIKNQAR